MTTHLVLWRHGQTDWNTQGRYQGRADVPLNERGVAQAHRAAAVLAKLDPVAIYCSPLGRALSTSRPLCALTSLSPIIDDRLLEIDVGSWVGRVHAEMLAENADFAAALANRHDFRRSASGETCGEAGTRVARALQELGDRYQGQTVVVVSHGLALRMGIGIILGWSHEQASQLGGMMNCAWSILGDRGQGWRLEGYNLQVFD